MSILVADLEGVFLPEIWINIAIRIGIDELKLTTRDISDYNVLMKQRLSILSKYNLCIKDIQTVIATLNPLPGAEEMLNWIRKRTQIIILSDTFEEFVEPLMEKLGFPTLLCHNLTINNKGHILDYNLRINNQKTKTVKALQCLNYQVIGFGDSYNDIGMIKAADKGFFFSPSENVIADYPDIPVTKNYYELKDMIESLLAQ